MSQETTTIKAVLEQTTLLSPEEKNAFLYFLETPEDAPEWFSGALEGFLEEEKTYTEAREEGLLEALNEAKEDVQVSHEEMKKFFNDYQKLIDTEATKLEQKVDTSIKKIEEKTQKLVTNADQAEADAIRKNLLA